MLLNMTFIFELFFFHFEKVKLMVNPFAYEEYRKDKIRQKIEETRAQRVQLKVDIVLYSLLSLPENTTFSFFVLFLRNLPSISLFSHFSFTSFTNSFALFYWS